MPTKVVGHFVEALERRDLGAAIRCVDRRVYFVSPEGADCGTREGFRRWWNLQMSSGSDPHHLQIEALDDHHVFAELLTGHPEGGRTWVAETLGCVYTVGDGMIKAIELFADAERARERARHTIEVLRRDGLLHDN